MQQTEDTVFEKRFGPPCALQLDKSAQFDTLVRNISQCGHWMKGIRLE